MIRQAWLSIRGLYNYDPTIFDDMKIPAELDPIVVRDNIINECAELEVIYPDNVFMKEAIKAWSEMEFPVWQHLYETTQYEYNPIWNKDGVFNETVTRDLAADGETVHDTMGFNSDKWANSTRDQSSGSDTGTVTTERTETGNIGVTTTQQMIKEEREIAEFNIIRRIIDDFKMRFCLLIY